MIEKYKHQGLTHKVIGAAMEVHRHPGNGFQEVVHQRALAIKFELQVTNYEREKEMPLVYKRQNIETRRVDFFIKEIIMLETKAVSPPEDDHPAKEINYLEAYSLEVGLLINFGNRSLQFKRVMKPVKNHSPSKNQSKS